jgi:hypothetical protein
MSDSVLKTSKEWSLENPSMKILDPDGWDRKNFEYSFSQEKITHEEFLKRLARSTCSFMFNIRG